MKNQLFEDLIESIKELPTELLEEMRMNMNEEQMRSGFEKWALSEGLDILRDGDSYFYDSTLSYWIAWQACKDFYEKED